MEEDRDWVRKQLEDNVPPGDIEEQLISRGYGIEEATSLVEQVQEGMEDTTYEEGEGKRQPDTNEAEDTARLLSPGVRSGSHIFIYILTIVAAVYNIWKTGGNQFTRMHFSHFVFVVYAAVGIVMELVGVHIQSIVGVGFLGGSWFTQSLHRIKHKNLPWFIVLAVGYLMFTTVSILLQLAGISLQFAWLEQVLEEMMLA